MKHHQVAQQKKETGQMPNRRKLFWCPNEINTVLPILRLILEKQQTGTPLRDVPNVRATQLLQRALLSLARAPPYQKYSEVL